METWIVTRGETREMMNELGDDLVVEVLATWIFKDDPNIPALEAACRAFWPGEIISICHPAGHCTVRVEPSDGLLDRFNQLQSKLREAEDQLCRIADCVGHDARGAPSHDPTVAGAAIAEIVRLRAK